MSTNIKTQLYYNIPVSYTHLDVYKRQASHSAPLPAYDMETCQNSIQLLFLNLLQIKFAAKVAAKDFSKFMVDTKI